MSSKNPSEQVNIEECLQLQSEDYDGAGVMQLTFKILRTGTYKIVAGRIMYGGPSPEEGASDTFAEGQADQLMVTITPEEVLRISDLDIESSYEIPVTFWGEDGFDETMITGDVGDQIPVTLRFKVSEEETARKRDNENVRFFYCFPSTEFNVYESEGCFVATACYGHPDHQVVECLRCFRDTTLERFRLGRSFIAWYYTRGPRAAAWLNDHVWVKPVIRAALTVFAAAWRLMYSICVDTPRRIDASQKQRG